VVLVFPHMKHLGDSNKKAEAKNSGSCTLNAPFG